MRHTGSEGPGVRLGLGLGLGLGRRPSTQPQALCSASVGAIRRGEGAVCRARVREGAVAGCEPGGPGGPRRVSSKGQVAAAPVGGSADDDEHALSPRFMVTRLLVTWHSDLALKGRKIVTGLRTPITQSRHLAMKIYAHVCNAFSALFSSH